MHCFTKVKRITKYVIIHSGLQETAVAAKDVFMQQLWE